MRKFSILQSTAKVLYRGTFVVYGISYFEKYHFEMNFGYEE